MATRQIYKTRVDWWIAALVFVFPPALFVWITIMEPRALKMMVLSGGFYAFIMFVLAYPIRYTLDDRELLVQAGFLIRLHIPVHGIVNAKLSSNPLSSPAMSLRRISIEYKKNGRTRHVRISPPDRLAFLHDLADRDEGLHLRGERLIRR
jgi:hypothetical protein